MSFDVNLYFSGNVRDIVNTYLIQNDVYRLSTFAYPKEAFVYLNLANHLGKRAKMMIDSGAFTAWASGNPVQLADLITYNEDLIKRYGKDHDFVFISLDKIPGTKAAKADSEEIARAVIQSMDNFKVLQQHFPNNKILPVYHSGEDVSLRNTYLQMTDYICLSMDQTMSENNRLEWAKRSIVPGFFFHGLASTGNRMITQVDWYSVDSSSWLTVAAMGGILWPTSKDTFRVLPLSKHSPNRHTANEHLATLPQVQREAAIQFITSKGFDHEKMIVDYHSRRIWNAYMWLNPPWKKAPAKPMDLFS